MKKIFTLIISLVIIGNLQSQQISNYTLFMMNPFVFNPALAGTANYYQIRSNHRFQWVGFKDAPITNSVSAFGPHRTKDMGFGGTIFNDVTGPISQTGAKGVYAYNISLTTDIRLSMGISAGFTQYKIDGTKIETFTPEDPAMPKGVLSSLIPDASVGVYAYSSNFHVGFSANQLLNSAVTKKVTDDIGRTTGINKLKSHFYLMGGYILAINREWDIEPGIVMQKMVSTPFQVEIYAKAIYENMFWGGLTFRSMDAASLAIGYTYDKKIFVGYAVDISVNKMVKYNYGSHEIFIGFNFDKIKKLSKKK